MSKLKTMYARSAVPLYIQIASALRQRIENGHWQPGQKISTLEDLEREFEVARVTVRLAIELLENEGLVHRQQGRGTFVADKVHNKHWLRLETSWESLIAPIKSNIPKIIKVDNPPPFPMLTEEDGKLAPEYVFLRSVQLKKDTPYAVVNLHLDRRIYKRDPEAFQTHTALPVLANLDGIDIEHAHQTLVIGTADPDTASLLQIPLGAPTAECRCVVKNREGVAIYVADITYRNDCVKLYIDLFGRSRPGAKRVPDTGPAPRSVIGRNRPRKEGGRKLAR
ncbi:MAG: GntR family transcriptional regulator [Betaproteobacteria bacterium]|nr:GntR family transcriptional regulator [Betaproteobacteria bacterium]